MILPAVFLESGLPKTGLSPTIKVRDVSTGTLVVNGSAMVEVGDGFYQYDFTTHDPEKAYAYQCDSVTLTGAERYAYGDVAVDQSLVPLAAIPTTPLLAENYTAPDNATISAIAGYLDTEITAIIAHLTDIKGAGWMSENLVSLDALIDTALSRLTSARAGYLDKLNVAGTLAHSGDADTYKADVSGIPAAVIGYVIP